MSRFPLCCGLLFILLRYAQSQAMCDFSKPECSTQVSNLILNLIAVGIPGETPPLDPVQLDEFHGQYLALNYKVPSSTLEGFSTCKPMQLRLNFDNTTYHNEIKCTKLVLKYDYDVKGLAGPVELDGKGFVTITYNDYLITIKGLFSQSNSDQENGRRFFVVTYDWMAVASGPVAIDVNGSLHPDKQKAAVALEYVKEHKHLGGVITGPVIMSKYVDKFVALYDAIMRKFPVESIFSGKVGK